jgi:hypothetical protein
VRSTVFRPGVFLTGAAVILLAATWNARGSAGGQPQALTDQQSVVGGEIPYSVGRALPDHAAGWTRAREIRMFSPADLWEYINGAAEQYLTYGFQDLATSKYTDASGTVVAADIYRMADAVHAFGIYRHEVNPKAQPVPLGVEGRAGSNTLKFWTGRFYVKLTASSGPVRRPDLQPLGAVIAKGLGAPVGLPAQVRWFPPAGLVPDSVKFVPADALGQASFTNAFEAKYENRGEPSTAFVVPFEGEAQAAAALAKYESFLSKARGKTTVSTPGDGGFSATDSFQGYILAVRAGSHLVLSLGASDAGTAAAIVAAIVKRLPPGFSLPRTRSLSCLS